MKKLFTLLVFLGTVSMLHAISPYLMIGSFEGDISSVEQQIVKALDAEGFEIIGQYNPGNNSGQRIIVYSRNDLKQLCSEVKDRGMLAAALKIGIRERKGLMQVTMLNPEYLFYAYLRDEMENSSTKNAAMNVAESAKKAMSTMGTDLEAFGGNIKADDLKKYKYMMGMPKFDDPVVLNEYGSFEEGLQIINGNLTRGEGNTFKVYEIIDKVNKIAVFGVGLLDPEKGESHFLGIIGEKHIAAMPYEIILQGNTVSMLHGRFRFASHWPELTMGTFTKIMSSPGDVEDFMKSIAE